jgi:hypothetical protein
MVRRRRPGIVEGDRVNAINGVSLRVATEDAGDPYMSSTRINRYRRELGKVKIGDDVELRVCPAVRRRRCGSSRSVPPICRVSVAA